MPTTDQLLANNQEYQKNFDRGNKAMPPGKKVAIVACMDARIHPARALGLDIGDAHIIRNAGGVITDDVIRSLMISQLLLGTEEIILIHHTDCGMLTFTDDAVKRQVQDQIGLKPPFALESFPDIDEDVRQSIARLQSSPFIPRKSSIRGFVYDVNTGALREVSTEPALAGA